MSLSPRAASLFASALLLSACGSGSSSPSAPTSPAKAPVVAAPVVSPTRGIALGVASTPTGDPYVESAATAPGGFVPKFRVDPHPGDDGVIRGDSSIQVEFDLCGSSNLDGKTHFLFDWNFDHVADVIGTGSACKQTHTYRAPATAQGQAQKTLRTNVCVTSGDPRGAAGDVFFSCRQYTIGLTAPRQSNEICGIFFGGAFTECVDVQARIIRQDGGNDGSFELVAQISTDTNVGTAECASAVSEVADFEFDEPSFYAFMLGLGFEPGNDFCQIL